MEQTAHLVDSFRLIEARWNHYEEAASKRR